MKSGLIIFVACLSSAAIAWLLTGTVLGTLSVGLVTFLFSLLGSLCYASEVHVDDTYASDSESGNAQARGEFGGRSISGTWK